MLELLKEAEETIEALARVKEQDENTIRDLKEEIEVSSMVRTIL